MSLGARLANILRAQPSFPSFERLPPAIRLCGVEEIDARFERAIEHRERRGLVDLAPKGDAPQAEAADFDGSFSQRSTLHSCSSGSFSGNRYPSHSTRSSLDDRRAASSSARRALAPW